MLSMLAQLIFTIKYPGYCSGSRIESLLLPDLLLSSSTVWISSCLLRSNFSLLEEFLLLGANNGSSKLISFSIDLLLSDFDFLENLDEEEDEDLDEDLFFLSFDPFLFSLAELRFFSSLIFERSFF